MSEEILTPVRSLGEIAKILNCCQNHKEEMNVALRLLGRTIGARGVDLIKKRFVEKDSFILECFGCWHACKKDVTPNACKLESLKQQDLPHEWWKRLEAHEPVVIKKLLPPILEDFSNLLFIPLFLGEHLFGFLAISDLEDNDLITSGLDFLEAVGHVFELWITKLNLEKGLNDFMDFMPHPICMMDKEGVVTAFSRSSEEMTGWKAELLLGKGNYELALPYYGERRPTVPNLILYPDPEWESKYREFKREGSTVFSVAYCPRIGAFLRCKTSVIYDVNGRISGSIHEVLDITRELQMEENLHRSESMYRAITDFAGVGIMLFNKDNIYYYNEHFSELLGISGTKVTLDHVINWIHPADRENVFKHFEDLFREHHETSRFEFSAQHGKGFKHYRGYVQLIEYEGKPSIHFIVDDITEQKELAQKARLNELRMYHEDRLTSLGIMAAGIAHELNQPLNTIRVVTDGLLFGKDEGWALDQEELFDNLEMISRQVVRMSQVIRNIRDFARDDRGQADGDVNLNEAVENVFSMIGSQLEAHGIQAQKDLAARLPPIKANLNRLEQVIMNLVVNARQALDECSNHRKELWVRTGVNNGQVFVEMGDNATGIPDGLISKIFDPFFTTKEVGKGTGLGLTISQSIVAEFKGTIEVFNNEREGATFVVSAPADGG